MKKVIAEMGGKNAIVIDADADFDLAIRDVIDSAFGYQGQKCSACSRLILPEAIHDSFLERLLPAIESIPLGPADDPSTVVGPLISEEAQRKVNRYIEIGKQEGELALLRELPAGSGYAVPIAVFMTTSGDLLRVEAQLTIMATIVPEPNTALLAMLSLLMVRLGARARRA